MTRWEFRVAHSFTGVVIKTFEIAKLAQEFCDLTNDREAANGRPRAYHVIPLSFPTT